MGRLAVLIPPPRVHTVRYFGVFAPRAALRRDIVPTPQPTGTHPPTADASRSSDSRGSHACVDTAPASAHPSRPSWAALLQRAFELDLRLCPRCGQAAMRHIAVITQPAVIRALLAAIARQTLPP